MLFIFTSLEAGKIRPYWMTFSPGNQDRSADEVEHEVVFQTRFSIAATEVTQAQYELVMGENPSCNKGDDDSWRFLAR